MPVRCVLFRKLTVAERVRQSRRVHASQRLADTAARILWTFSKRSLRGDAPDTNDPHAARKDQRVIKSIPPRVLENAQGLAIMTIFRTGLGWSAASGSGVVIARDTPTSWGPSK